MNLIRIFIAVLSLAYTLAGFGAESAMERVNWQRAQQGLPPFMEDSGLTKAAMAAADFRAAHGMEGHSSNDFSFLPRGTSAPVAGCAAWHYGAGFGACDLYSNYKYAGCAWVQGRDGRVFCHAFYSNSPSK